MASKCRCGHSYVMHIEGDECNSGWLLQDDRDHCHCYAYVPANNLEYLENECDRRKTL